MNYRTPLSLTLALALGLGLSGLSAQRTWIVDAAGGSGYDFKTIAAAVTAAANGDRIRVRSGTYRGAVVRKPLFISGEGGAEIKVDGYHPGFDISGIAAGQFLSISGFRFPSPTSADAFTIAKCAGRVCLADIEVVPPAVLSGSVFTDCDALTIDRSTLTAVEATRCRVAATRCVFRESLLGNHYNAVHLVDSHAVLTQCRAGLGYTYRAVFFEGSTLELRGDASSLYVGARVQIGYHQPRYIQYPALDGLQSQLIRDGKVSIVPPHIPKQEDLIRAMPWLSAIGGRIGSSIDLSLVSPADEPYALFVGMPGEPLPLASFGHVWLDLRATFLIQAGSQATTGNRSTQRSVPNVAELVGLVLNYQAVAGNSPALTNPATVIVTER